MNSSEKAYRKLRGMILSGELPPGAPLREEEVAILCEVSRTPVRDAIRQLENEMFVRRTETQRTFVAEWSSRDIEEVFTLRGLLEGFAARRAAELAEDAQIERLRTLNSAMAEAVEQTPPDFDQFLAINSQFHAIIMEMSASDRLASMLNRLILQPIVQRTALRYDQARLRQSLADHEEITAALAERDGQWAEAVITAHVRRAYHVYISESGNRENGGRPDGTK